MPKKDPKAFLKITRKSADYRPVEERIKDYNEVFVMREQSISKDQALRCMDCGTPFCHYGCPLGNLIPEWNELLAHGMWKEAYELLSSTNNLPEMTGRVCPALCEYACVLGVNDDSVTIRENELDIIEHAFENGYVKPRVVKERTGKKVAIIGGGPAGMAAADQLNQAGHSVVVFEKYPKVGGLLRYGIPDFKLKKEVIDRRLKVLEEEGIEFRSNTNVGKDISVDDIKKDFDAVLLTTGSRVPRDLTIDGRYLKGVHFAMEFLTQTNMQVSGDEVTVDNPIDAKNKNVVVIGGGDTGSDCIGTANRQGAKSITQLEVMPMPADARTDDYPWPNYPMLLKTTSSHEEGASRNWSILTKRFIGEEYVEKIQCVEVEWVKTDDGRMKMVEKEGSEFSIDADLVVLAIGFLHTEHDEFLSSLGVEFDNRGNATANEKYMTSSDGVFSAGDARTGQSLVVRVIKDARAAAYHIDEYLTGSTSALPLP